MCLNGPMGIQTHGLKNFSYEKKDNVGLYLKDDYKTRDVDETFTVGVLWPHFLEQGGTRIIRFNSN